MAEPASSIDEYAEREEGKASQHQAGRLGDGRAGYHRCIRHGDRLRRGRRDPVDDAQRVESVQSGGPFSIFNIGKRGVGYVVV